jgi:hypothetical protein
MGTRMVHRFAGGVCTCWCSILSVLKGIMFVGYAIEMRLIMKGGEINQLWRRGLILLGLSNRLI